MSEENKKPTKELTELLIVLKGNYALEVCAGIYCQNTPEQHPYVDFIKRYGKVHKITGWNLIHCAMEEQWIDHKYHLVEHIYKKGEKILEEHKDRKEVLNALEEINREPEILRVKIVEEVAEATSHKETIQTQTKDVSIEKLEQVL